VAGDDQDHAQADDEDDGRRAVAVQRQLDDARLRRDEVRDRRQQDDHERHEHEDGGGRHEEGEAPSDRVPEGRRERHPEHERGRRSAADHRDGA